MGATHSVNDVIIHGHNKIEKRFSRIHVVRWRTGNGTETERKRKFCKHNRKGVSQSVRPAISRRCKKYNIIFSLMRIKNTPPHQCFYIMYRERISALQVLNKLHWTVLNKSLMLESQGCNFCCYVYFRLFKLRNTRDCSILLVR